MSHVRPPRSRDLGYHATKRRMPAPSSNVHHRSHRDARAPEGLSRAQAAPRARAEQRAADAARAWLEHGAHGHSDRRGHRRARRRRPHDRRGRVLRPARAQRRGQDDDDRDPHDARAAVGRPGVDRRRRRRHAGGGRAAPHRRRAAAAEPGPRPRRPREPDVPRGLLRLPTRGLARARPRHPRTPRPGRSRGLARRRAVGRPAPAPHDRARARARAARDLPRRADGGPRPAGPPRALGHPARAPRRRPHDRHDDALHGRGGEAVRARRDRRPRQAPRVRRARRAQEAGAGWHARRAHARRRGGARARGGARRRRRARRRELDGATLRVYHPDGGGAVARLISVVHGAGREVTNIRLVPPNLETLFLSLTGRKLG